MKPSLIVSAGKGCFMACKGCYQFFGEDAIDTLQIINFVADFKRKFNLEKVTLAGGDPLSRKDIIFLTNTLHDLGLKISMDTTGLPIIKKTKIVFHDKGYVEKIDVNDLKNVSMLGIPCDGHNDETILKFRDNIGIEEIKNILQELSKANISVCINTVVSKCNYLHLKEIFNIIKDYSCVKKWQLFQYSPIGEIAYMNREKFEISNQMFIYTTDELMKLETRIRIEPKSNSFRKRKYILLNSDGIVWTPKYSNCEEFITEDTGSDKIIFGNINNPQNLWNDLETYINRK